jgi:uncharacterized protein (DUF697 family)
MSRTTLQRSTAHLAASRRLILGHAAATALGGLLPIPFLDAELPALVKRAMIKRIAEARRIDIDDEAVRIIAEGRVSKPSWKDLLTLGPFVRSAGRSVRAAFVAYAVYRRAESASRAFALGTLFDHYCARHHTGLGIDAERARELRQQIERALERSDPSLGSYAFRRGLKVLSRGVALATRRAPIEIARALTWDRLRLRGRKPDDALEAEAEEIVESTIDKELATKRSFLGRMTRSADQQLSNLGNGWIDGMVAAFESEFA